jgi:release factor glutamine methyltransferase
MTIASILSSVGRALAEAGFDEARRRARRLVAAALGLSAAEVFSGDDRQVSEEEAARVAEWLRRVLAHEPLSRISGAREFWGLEFLLSPETLDPRPETETVVETVLAQLPDRSKNYRFLDLGTGTGCLLLALLAEYPAASGVGVDRSFGAAATARHNAERLGMAPRARFIVGDWANALIGRFDVIVSNPPYIERAEIPLLPREVRDFDPVLALDGGDDGLDAYRAIAAEAPRVLASDGVFACEVGAGQADAVARLLGDAGLIVEAIVPDLAGITRCVVARADAAVLPARQKNVGTAYSPA